MPQHAPPHGQPEIGGRHPVCIPEPRGTQRSAEPDRDVAVALAAAKLGVTLWMTCTHDSQEHAVTDPALVAGYEAGQGIYQAVCDHLVSPQTAATTTSARCRRCEDRLQDQARDQPDPRWMQWLRDLTGAEATPWEVRTNQDQRIHRKPANQERSHDSH